MTEKNKILIAYYSRTGTNETAAKALQEELKCGIEEVIDTVNRKGSGISMMWCAMDALFRRTTKIEHVKNNPGDYDLVVVATPVWAGNLPPASRTYVMENREKFNKIAFLSVSGNGAGNKKALPDFESLAGRKTESSLMLTEKEVKDGAFKEKIQSFAGDILGQN